jgi:hypothetical protein
MDREIRDLALILVLGASAGASGPGTADGLVLAVPAFAGQMMLGEAGWAIAGGADAAAGNPACLGSGFTATGGRWSLETTVASAAGAFRPAPGIAAGGVLRYAGSGGIQGRDLYGSPTGEYSWSSGAAGVSVSFPLPAGLRGGLSASTLWESIEDDDAAGFSSSAGVSYIGGDSFEAGIALRNAGAAPSWDGITKNLPTEVSLGAKTGLVQGVSLAGGASIGFWTASRFSACAICAVGGLSAAAGWTLVPGEDQASGPFGGLGWEFSQGSTYSAALSVRRMGDMSWPVLAGISVAF